MLSNKDFSQFLQSGKSSKTDSKSWEMKQIKAFDQQNKSKFSNAHSKGKGKSGPPGKPVTEADSNAVEESDSRSQYRDRAEERRADTNPDYDSSKSEHIANLDIEYSKFLGGDTEHTHLVKGLDYVLLQKIRNEKKLEDKMNKVSSQSTSDKPLCEICPVTSLGMKVKLLMLRNTLPCSRERQQMEQLPVLAPSWSRMAYEFNVDIVSDVDIPTTISRSSKVGVYIYIRI